MKSKCCACSLCGFFLSVPIVLLFSSAVYFQKNNDIHNFNDLLRQYIVRIGRFTRKIGFQELEIVRIDLMYEDLPNQLDGLKIVQLSDFHYSLWESDTCNLELVEKAINETNNIKPDFVFLTGDFIQWDKRSVKNIAETLKKIEAPKFGVLGTHDALSAQNRRERDKIIKNFKQFGNIDIVDNSFREINNLPLTIFGFGDPHDKTFNSKFLESLEFQKSHQKEQDKRFYLSMSHNTDTIKCLLDYKNEKEFCKEVNPRNINFDLVLSGHTHGGQIRLFGKPIAPFFKGFAGFDNIVSDWKFDHGLFSFKSNSSFAYVNRGLGSHLNLRINCPPELTQITLRKK